MVKVFRNVIMPLFYFRVAFYPDTTERFWVNHDKYRCHPLITLLTDLRRFVEETKEVVFLDFHSFPIGFNNSVDVHNELIKFVMSEIGKHLVPKTYPNSVTPNMLWKANKTIIWTYSDNSISSMEDNKHLWPYLIHVSTLIEIKVRKGKIVFIHSHCNFRHGVTKGRKKIFKSI